MELAVSFDEIVEEIARFTEFSRQEIAYRVWMEAIDTGWNVMQDAVKFGITPYHYNKNMELLYTEGYGFIFDCLVFWSKPNRQRWISQAYDRIKLYHNRVNVPSSEVRVLILGDGPGSDSLFLAKNGFQIYYYDVQGSKTYEFALKRFQYYGYFGSRIQPVEDYSQCLHERYDIVLSFEVLEHIPDPIQAVHDIAMMLKPGGLAIITEDFGNNASYLPTHLHTSNSLFGKTPFIFLKDSMRLTWYSREPLFKPYEFTKVNDISTKDWFNLLKDPNTRGRYLYFYKKNAAELLNRAIYFRGDL